MSETKLCHRCEETKSVVEFHRDASKDDGLHTLCKTCKEVAQKKWRMANKDNRKVYQKKYRADNRESLLEGKKQWYSENKERHLANATSWAKNNQEAIKIIRSRYRKNTLGAHNARANKRRAIKLAAVPDWLTKSHLVEIEYMYMYNQIMPGNWHVDHIVPLQGKDVCGLHTPENLQILSAKDNLMKSNKFKEVA